MKSSQRAVRGEWGPEPSPRLIQHLEIKQKRGSIQKDWKGTESESGGKPGDHGITDAKKKCSGKMGPDGAESCWEVKHKEWGDRRLVRQSQWSDSTEKPFEAWEGTRSSWSEKISYILLSSFATKGSKQDGLNIDCHDHSPCGCSAFQLSFSRTSTSTNLCHTRACNPLSSHHHVLASPAQTPRTTTTPYSLPALPPTFRGKPTLMKPFLNLFYPRIQGATCGRRKHTTALTRLITNLWTQISSRSSGKWRVDFPSLQVDYFALYTLSSSLEHSSHFLSAADLAFLDHWQNRNKETNSSSMPSTKLPTCMPTSSVYASSTLYELNAINLPLLWGYHHTHTELHIYQNKQYTSHDFKLPPGTNPFPAYFSVLKYSKTLYGK